MTLVIPQGFAHVIHSLAYIGDSEAMAMTYGVNVNVAATPADLAAACALALEEIQPVLSDQVSVVGCEVTYQADPLPAPPLVGVNASSFAGTAGGAVVPQNTAFLIHKRSSVGGRGGRGRMYQPGVGEALVGNNGALATGTPGDLTTAYEAFRTALEGSTEVIEMVILHDSEGAFAAEDPAVVTALVCDPVVATQRRRLRH